MSAALDASGYGVAADWLAHLYEGHDGWLTLFAVDRGDARRQVVWRKVEDLDDMARAAEVLEPTCDVWFGVATRADNLGAQQRGGAEHCRTLPALWVDIDVKGPNHAAEDLPTTMEEAIELVEAFPVAATALVASGGGIQAWWLLAEPLDVADGARELLARWGATWAERAARRGWHLDNVFDLARIMRLPGTTNRKNTPRPVEVLAVDWSLRYGVDDLEQWTIDPPAPPLARPTERVPYIGPERPGDAYNARHSVEDVLVELGFEAHARRHSDGSLHFRWPGASGDTGATSYADGHATVWSETFGAAHPHVELRRPYDPFGLLTAARHGGDHAEATRALRQQGYGAPSVDIADVVQPEVLERFERDLRAAQAVTLTPQEELAAVLEHGWHPSPLDDVLADDYEPPVPDLFRRADGAGLLYSGRVNGFHGESGSGKSWMAMAAAAQALTEGAKVLYVDLEDHLGSVVARLRALGVPAGVLAAQFDYIAPEGPYTLPAKAAVEQLVAERRHALVVIDSTGEAMANDGAKQNDDDAVAQWNRRLPRALASLGPAVVLIDHVPKDSDAPKLYAIGSQRKRAAIDGAAYRVEAGVHPAKGRTGRLRLIVAKDRNGAFQAGTKAADVTIDSSIDGRQVRIAVELPEAVHRPTVLMERVSRYLELHPGATQRSIIKDVSGKTEGLKLAVEVLIAEGHIRVGRDGQAVTHDVIEPFRNPEHIDPRDLIGGVG